MIEKGDISMIEKGDISMIEKGRYIDDREGQIYR